MTKQRVRSNSPIERPAYNLYRTAGRKNFSIYDKNHGSLPGHLGEEDIVLDLGSGFGSDFMLWLRERGYKGQIINLDINTGVFIERDQNKDPLYEIEGDLNIQGDAEKIPLRRGSVSLVHQSGLLADLEYQVSSGNVFREVWRVLKRNGVYVINDSISPTHQDGFSIMAPQGRFPEVYMRRQY